MNEKLKEERIKRLLTQRDVARSVGVTETAYHNYEVSGRVPKITVAARIAKFFGKPIEYFWDVEKGNEEYVRCVSCGKKIYSASKDVVCIRCAYQAVTVSDSIKKLREVCRSYKSLGCEGCTIKELCRKNISQWKKEDFKA